MPLVSSFSLVDRKLYYLEDANCSTHISHVPPGNRRCHTAFISKPKTLRGSMTSHQLRNLRGRCQSAINRNLSGPCAAR
jgi:hypothetical protein